MQIIWLSHIAMSKVTLSAKYKSNYNQNGIFVSLRRCVPTNIPVPMAKQVERVKVELIKHSQLTSINYINNQS